MNNEQTLQNFFNSCKQEYFIIHSFNKSKNPKNPFSQNYFGIFNFGHLFLSIFGFSKIVCQKKSFFLSSKIKNLFFENESVF
jgi:hypothetical protein